MSTGALRKFHNCVRCRVHGRELVMRLYDGPIYQGKVNHSTSFTVFHGSHSLCAPLTIAWGVLDQ